MESIIPWSGRQSLIKRVFLTLVPEERQVVADVS